MKYYLSMTLFFAIAAQSFAQLMNYRKDAEQLSGRLFENNDLVEEIPTALIDSLENILLAVASFDHPKAKVVTQKFNIRTRPSCDVHSFRFVTSTDYTWVKKFKQSQSLAHTPLATLAEVYPQFQLSIADEQEDYTTFTFYSPTAVNISFFAREISMMSGIDMVMLGSSQPASANESDIKIRRIDSAWIVSYYFQSGDSYDQQYYWQFGVTDEGQVRFLGEYGEAIPPDYEASLLHSIGNQ